MWTCFSNIDCTQLTQRVMVQTHSGLSARLLSLILVLLSISLSLTVISELARPVTAISGSAAKITTTQDQTLYESSFQNFGFYAQGRYWVFYEDTAFNCEGMGGMPLLHIKHRRHLLDHSSQRWHSCNR